MKTMAWLPAVFPTVLILVVSVFLPRWGSPGTYFSVTVDPAFPASTAGLVIARRYRREIGIVAMAALLAFALVSWATRGTPSGPAFVLVPVLVQTLGLFVALARAHAAVLPQAVAVSTVRRASLQPVETATRGFLGFGPYLLLAVAGILLLAGWSSIPERFPVQWGFDGHPSRFQERSGVGVFLPLLIGTTVCAFLRGLARITPHLGRVAPEGGHRSTLRALLATEYLIAGVFSLTALATAFRWSGGAPLIASAAMGGTVLLLVFITRTATTRAAEAGSRGDGLPDSAWKWGLFYVNPDDPAVLVPKRLGLGYTLNFARPVAWVFLLGILAFGAGLVALVGLAARR